MNWTQKLKKAEFFSEKLITVQYEDLIENNEGTLNFILDRLDIPSELRKKTKPQRDYFHNMGARQKSLHQNIREQLQTGFIAKWKEELSNKEIMVFTYWAGNYLEKYGYETSVSPRFSVFVYSLYYSFLFFFEKTINTLKLSKHPSKLRIKVKRILRMLKRN